MMKFSCCRLCTLGTGQSKKSGRLRGVSLLKMAGFALLFCAAAILSPAQTFSTLASLEYRNGVDPFLTSLVQGLDGNFYGTAYQGGTYKDGTVFKIAAVGTVTTLHSFDSTDGNLPLGGLVQGTDGNFYGITYAGGNNGAGSVFKISASGLVTTLYSFCSQTNCTDGSSPQGALVQATDGNFYGTAAFGGANNKGTIFKITPSGALITLYSFCSLTACADGRSPETGLIQAADGNFYGTTYQGGVGSPCYVGCGTIFKFTPSGALTTLHSFCSQINCTDGASPLGALVQVTDGNFYGTTAQAGGTPIGGGTVFKITPTGTLTTVYTFCSQTSCSDGESPSATLIQATDGNLYGTTVNGGTNADGTIFEITPSGTLTTLHSFDGTDGSAVNDGLLQSTSGILYGITGAGGTKNIGTVFSLSVGLGPFVKTLSPSGKVGQAIKVLGQGFDGTTAVSFNGVPASFTVRSDTYLTATVPVGATTGKITVTTPSGTLMSNVAFRVRP